MERYRLQRRLVGPIYSANGIKKHEDHLTSTLSSFMARIKGFAGAPLELALWMNVWAIGKAGPLVVNAEAYRSTVRPDTLTEITFSHRMGYIEDGDDEGNRKAVDKAWRSMHLMGLYPSLWVLVQYIGPIVKAVSGGTWRTRGDHEVAPSFLVSLKPVSRTMCNRCNE